MPTNPPLVILYTGSMQKISQIHPFIEIRAPCPFLTTATQKLLTLIVHFIEFPSACKKSANSSTHSSIHLVTRVATTISDHTHPNNFLSTLNFWYEHVKKQTISSLCSRDIFDLKSFSLIGQHRFLDQND